MHKEEMEMGTRTWKIQLLELPQATRTELIRKIRRKLSQNTLEAKMWQELLQVDNLTINGITVWKGKQPRGRFYVRSHAKE
jgi:hypothetical protein